MKIAIIGTGLAGLATAYLITKEFSKVELSLFEAGNRIGGRVYTLTGFSDPEAYVEAGGGSITDQNQKLLALISEMKLSLIERNDRFDKKFYEGGKFKAQSDSQKIMKFLMDYIEKLYANKIICNSSDWIYNTEPLLANLDGLPLIDFLQKQLKVGSLQLKEPEHLRTRLGETLLGMYSGNIDKLSTWGALYYLHQFRNVQKIYQIKGGNDVLPKALRASLKETTSFYMESPVSKVSLQPNGQYSITSQNYSQGDFDFIIVTVPLSTLRSTESIRFDPPLSSMRQEAIKQIGITRHVIRTYYEMNQSDWQMTIVDKSTLWIETPTIQQSKLPVLEAHASNRYGKTLGLKDNPEPILTQEMRTIYGAIFSTSRANAEPKTVNWQRERFFQGAYPYPKVGNRKAYRIWLEENESKGIIFAGEAASYHCASMEGAIESAYLTLETLKSQNLIEENTNQHIRCI